MKNRVILIIFLSYLLVACGNEEKNTVVTTAMSRQLATQINAGNEDDNYLQMVDNAQTKINFTNKVVVDDFKNHVSYKQIYNGAGVAVGDINNDGLPDIYFAGNSADDRLYLNKGNFEFEDITTSAGIKKYTGGWSYGVNMVDINADGLLDIYVCKAGPYSKQAYKRNKLFINAGNGSFIEDSANYGLDIASFSVQSAFFDYDLDGDLDLYLINHPGPGEVTKETKNLRTHVANIKSGKLRTDNFYENVRGKYIEKTKEVNVSNYGYKNGIAVGDMNKDGYPDIYVCTDFGEPDLYYVNNGDKTFTNAADTSMKHITYNSMGAEFSDINNDGNLDVYVMDMTPSDHVRSKQLMASMDSDKFHAFAAVGFHRQYMLNSLQLNNGDNTFSEIGQLAGIAKTDWSWAPLFFDIDLDGKKDLYISNGVVENINDNDINLRVAEKEKQLNRKLSLNEFLDVVPSEITANQVYKNTGNLHFSETTETWMDTSNFNSNGAAYADLDADGDLDLVVSNMGAKASIYKNTGAPGKTGNAIAIHLKGTDDNTFALGTKIEIPLQKGSIYHEHYPSRGYLSSVDYKIVLGLGTLQSIPEMIITWPDGKVSRLENIAVNSEITVSYEALVKLDNEAPKTPTYLQKTNVREMGISYTHKEDKIDDFKEQVLLPYSQSQNGPFIASADVNGDGRDDFYVGGASGSSGALFLQNDEGGFANGSIGTWETDKPYEDQGVAFFDYDSDGDQDLYVASGGAAFQAGSKLYQDRLYQNDGDGNFSRILKVLPVSSVSTQVVRPYDVDGDGDLDVFVGGRVVPNKYPYSPKSSLLLNDNGVLKDVTAEKASSLMEVGLITGAEFSDYDNDGDADLIVVGEWTSIQIFNNDQGSFTKTELPSLQNSEGLWFSIKALDIDSDGDDDYLIGNLGLNSKFTAKEGKPFHVFCDDFDENGTWDVVFSKDYKGSLVPMRGRECSSEQMPFIAEKFTDFVSFAEASLDEIIGDDKLQRALHYQVGDFRSICLINQGNGNFTKVPLPAEAQFSPIMNFTIADIDKDGTAEIITMGNLYSTEVETTRYDASRGTVLKYDGSQFLVVSASRTGLGIDGDTKDALILKRNNETMLLVANNNSSLEAYVLK